MAVPQPAAGATTADGTTAALATAAATPPPPHQDFGLYITLALIAYALAERAIDAALRHLAPALSAELARTPGRQRRSWVLRWACWSPW